MRSSYLARDARPAGLLDIGFATRVLVTDTCAAAVTPDHDHPMQLVPLGVRLNHGPPVGAVEHHAVVDRTNLGQDG